MAIRTIKVDITGLKEIEKAQKAVSTLRDSVLDFEKRLKKMGGKGSSTLSFNVNLKLNTDRALSDYLALKRQIENIPIKVGTKRGSNSDSNVPTVEKTKVSRPTGKSTDYVKVRDQDYQSWRNLHKVVQDVSNATFGLTSRMVSLGAVNPAKGLLATFTKVNSTVLGIQNNLLGFVGNRLSGAIGNAIQGTLGAVKSGVSQLKDEANNLGDAMQVYRINMQALGFDEKETNKSIKRLGDYGKASVFDATDLLEQASTYTAYGRKDAESIVRGYAGLLAQTKNPVQGMKTVTTQTSQMLANGFLNQGDYRFIRERLSALGASKLNAELLKIAQSKGEASITDATRKKLITADEYLDAVNKLGNQDIFQNLVTSIVTPRQALANFKETLSNLLVFDEIDEEGNAKPGALNQVYVATRDFIKGITEIVGTNKFKEYVTKLGNAIGGTIQKVNQFGTSWKLAFGKQTLESIENFSKGFIEGVKGLDVAPLFFNITREVNKTIASSGKSFGYFAKDLVTNVSNITSSLASLSTQFIQGDGLKIFSNYLEVFSNLGKLAVKSGSVKDFIDIYKELSSTLNKIILSIKPSDVKNVTNSIRLLAVQVLGFIENITGKTTLISSVSEVFSNIINTLSTIVNKLSKFNPQSVNKILGYLRKTIHDILEHIEPIIVELGQGAITALSSSSGKTFFKAVGNFVKAVTSAIKQFLTSIGGSVEGGFKKILDFLSGLVDFASKIANVLGVVGKYVLMGFIGAKFASWATNIISSLVTVATAMASVTNGRVNPFGLAGKFGYDGLMYPGSPVCQSTIANANKVGLKARGKAFYTSISDAWSRGYNYKSPDNNLYGRDLGMDTFLRKGHKGRTLNPKAVGNWLADYQTSIINNADPIYKAKAKLQPAVNGMKEVTKELKGFKGTFKLPPGAKTIGLLGGQIAVDSLNGAVQNSDVGQGWKDAGNVLASTTSWASTGAMIGSVVPGLGTGVGAGIGALIGLGSSLYGIFNRENENKKLEEEAKKQAKEEAIATYKQQLASIKQLADENARIRDAFFSSVTKDSSLTESVSTANSYIEAVKNNSGSLQTALKTIGVETAKVPENVKDLFVKVGDTVKSWNELKQETGIEDDAKLLQALQVAQATLGEEYVNFVNSTGEQVIKQVRTLNEGDFNRNKANANTFEATFTKLGLALQEGRNFVYKDISNITSEIQGILDSKDFYSKEDKAKALQELYGKVGADTSNIVTQSIDKQFEIAQQIVKEGSILGGTNEQKHANLAKTISEKLGNFSTVFEDFIKNSAVKELEQVNSLLDEAKLVNAEKGTVAGQLKAKEFVQKVDGLVKDGSLKVNEANAIISSAGISRLSTENVKKSTVGYKKSIVDMLNNSTLPILNSKDIVTNSGIISISTSGISGAVRALRLAVRASIDDTIAKLDEALANATAKGNVSQQRAYSNYRRQAENERSVGGLYTGGLVPEYHSNGLPVGINWKGRGTDTVPTMLTPGEYVLRKKAVDSLGTNLLNNLNKYGVGALQNIAKSTIINNVYNTNNAQINQNIDNKSQYLNGMFGVDKLMRYI